MKYFLCSSGVAVFQVTKGGFRQYFHTGSTYTSSGFYSDIPCGLIFDSCKEISEAQFNALIGLWCREFSEV
jgi:hypothetical protein